jgi:hypothetical protein
MPNVTYNGFLEALAKAQANLVTATIKMMLVQAGYVPNKDHRFVNQVTNEISVIGYARQTLANKTVTRDDANDFAILDADDPLWTTLAAGQTIAGAVLFLDLGSDATSLLMGLYEISPAQATRDYFAIQFAAPAQGGAVKLYQP